MTDFTEVILPLIGAALGALIGWVLFSEQHNIVACGIIGCSVGLLANRWRRRRTGQ